MSQGKGVDIRVESMRRCEGARGGWLGGRVL